MRKRVYFVRHGQSEGNMGDLRGHEDHALTERGREQAAFIAKRCAKLPIKSILASPMIRARDTAGYISQELGLTTVWSDLFIEAQGPSEFRNLPRDHEPGLEFDKEFEEHFEDPDWRFSDAENFQDLKTRAFAALHLLEEQEEDELLVVTHGFFMRVLMACVVFGHELTASECREFTRTFHMENTGLSILICDSEKSRPWWVWVWNDHTHLAELG
jgi:probable phosphoglycerate mutase